MKTKLDMVKEAILEGQLRQEDVQNALLSTILAVLEEILEEMRVQNDVDYEEQGHTSLSDQ